MEFKMLSKEAMLRDKFVVLLAATSDAAMPGIGLMHVVAISASRGEHDGFAEVARKRTRQLTTSFFVTVGES
jgi:threonine/homoserine/homoserine lactone efflux protein